MDVELKVPGMELTANVLQRLLRGMQDVGRFFASLSVDLPTVKRYMEWSEVLFQAFSLAESEASGPIVVTNCPVIYNPTRWHNEYLSGYAGRDFQLSPLELRASYLECWAHCVTEERLAAKHILKCLLWFHVNRASDLEETLKLFGDLISSGFIVHFPVLSEVWWDLVGIFGSAADLSFLRGTTLADRDVINRGLVALLKSWEKSSPDGVVPQEMLDWATEFVLELADRARAASSLDDWFVSCAALSTPSTLVAGLLNSAGPNIGFGQRCVLSYIEELSADLMVLTHGWYGDAAIGSPLVWDLNYFEGMGKEYRKLYPKSEWLQRVTGDRLLVPDTITKHLEARGPIEPDKIDLPTSWKVPSAAIAGSLCFALEVDPGRQRAEDFSGRQIEGACYLLGLPVKRNMASNDDSVVAARKALVTWELLEFSKWMDHPDPVMAAQNLKPLRTLYPWSPGYLTWVGLISLKRSSLEDAWENLVLAIQIDPNDFHAWSGVSAIASQKQNQIDAKLFSWVSTVCRIEEEKR